MKHQTFNRRRLVSLYAAVVLSAATGQAAAAQLDLPVNPLLVSNDVAPNIMFLVDNSGSMTNIIPEAPYDPDVTYLATCPAANQWPVNTSVDLNTLRAGGDVLMEAGGDRWEFGTGNSNDERCFVTETIYGARLLADSSNNTYRRPGNYLDSEYTGNYLNWYFSNNPVAWTGDERRKQLGGGAEVNRRMDVARTATANLVNSLDERLRIGLSTFDGSVGARLLEPIGSLTDAGKRAALITEINALSPSGTTPIAEALSEIGRYYAKGYTGNLTLHPGEDNESTETVANVFNNQTIDDDAGGNPITLSCQQSFATLVTDGRPQSDQNISASFADYDGDCPGCGLDMKGAPYGYESAGSDYLDDVAQGLFEMDLRPDFPVETDSGVQFVNNVVSYLIGFADNQVLNDPLVQDAGAQGGGGFFSATGAQELADTFSQIITNILERATAFASASLNSTSLNAGTRLFQAGFNAADWTGTLRAFPVSTGAGGACPAVALGLLCPSSWNASTVLDNKVIANRVVYTYDPVNEIGTRFLWDNLQPSQQALLNVDTSDTPFVTDALGSARVNYIRGDRVAEGVTGFRIRGSRLGDIVTSNPFFVGTPNAAFPFGGYNAFRNANQNRTPMVYVGANDGMLHGFRVSDGEELLAYVPGSLYGTATNPSLAKLTANPYEHVWGVEGSPTVGDVQVGLSSAWRTYLVSTTGYGSQGVFALDVTNPSAFANTDVAASGVVKWEFTHADDADLGYSFSEPRLVKMQNDRWAVIIGNGFNNREADGSVSADGRAALFVLFVDGPGADNVWNLGTDYLKFKVGPSPTSGQIDNALATASPIDLNGDSLVDYIFAGDLYGNLWQFNVNSSASANWTVAYSGNALFQTASNAGAAQPITAAVEVGLNLATTDPDDIVVLFGTGQYIAVGDNDVVGEQTQTFYGIFADPISVVGPTLVETSSSPNAIRSQMLRQYVLDELTTGGLDVRVTSQEPLNPATHKGWYMDLFNTNGNLSATGPNLGERQVSRPILRNGRIIFTTLIPSPDPCDFGGSAWLMEVEANSGGRPNIAALDITSDLVVDDDDDFIEIDLDGDNQDDKVFVSGIGSKGLLSTPAVLSLSPTQEAKYSVTSNEITAGSGNFTRVFGEAGAGRTGRLTWREIEK